MRRCIGAAANGRDDNPLPERAETGPKEVAMKEIGRKGAHGYQGGDTPARRLRLPFAHEERRKNLKHRVMLGFLIDADNFTAEYRAALTSIIRLEKV
jgi:hypothetical protein